MERGEGREQRVSDNLTVLPEAQRLLEELECLWRNRIERIGEILTGPEEGARR